MSEEIPIEIHNTLEQVTTGSLLRSNCASPIYETTHSSEQIDIQPTIASVNESKSAQKRSSNIHCTDEHFWVISFKAMTTNILEKYSWQDRDPSGRTP